MWNPCESSNVSRGRTRDVARPGMRVVRTSTSSRPSSAGSTSPATVASSWAANVRTRGSFSSRSPASSRSPIGRRVDPTRTMPWATISETPRGGSIFSVTPPSFPSRTEARGRSGSPLVRTAWPSRRTSFADSRSSRSCAIFTSGTIPLENPCTTRSSVMSSWVASSSRFLRTYDASEPVSSRSPPPSVTRMRSNRRVPRRRPSLYAR